jgi:hypothetical protein
MLLEAVWISYGEVFGVLNKSMIEKLQKLTKVWEKIKFELQGMLKSQ